MRPSSIVKTYNDLLATDPELTMPVAAIESFILLLSHPPPPTTISETLDLLATATANLKRAVPNPISLSAGTDLFQRYLITTLQRPSTITPAGSSGDFKAIRQHLLSNGRLFVKRAKEARNAIAEVARRFVRDGSVVLTNGGSRVVGAVLKAAAEAQAREGGSPRFKVIYVTSPSSSSSDTEGTETIRSLRALSVPVAAISEAAVAYSMGGVSMVLVGAEGVVENGGIISRMGTYQMGILAKAAGKPMYVVAESHKFVRMFPLGQYDLPIEQNVVKFTTENAGDGDGDGPGEQRMMGGVDDGGDRNPGNWTEKTPAVKEKGEYFDKPELVGLESVSEGDRGVGRMRKASAVDYTPPDLITALITESGVHTPSAVSEELIKIWY